MSQIFKGLTWVAERKNGNTIKPSPPLIYYVSTSATAYYMTAHFPILPGQTITIVLRMRTWKEMWRMLPSEWYLLQSPLGFVRDSVILLSFTSASFASACLLALPSGYHLLESIYPMHIQYMLGSALIQPTNVLFSTVLFQNWISTVTYTKSFWQNGSSGHTQYQTLDVHYLGLLWVSELPTDQIYSRE